MLVIGVMSGTSLDAFDIALVEIAAEDETVRLRVRDFAMLPYPDDLRQQVRAILPPQAGSTADVCAVNVLLGEAFAAAARHLIPAQVGPDHLGLISSHGQTVYHQVAPGAVRSTLQLGAPAVIAERTGWTVAADFRPRDIAAGGQGAPLVPYLDVLLLHDDRINRAAQNIGGMGNVTYVPADGPALAFDTGPGNVLIDEAVALLTEGAQRYDRDGAMAARGTPDDALVTRWLGHPFFVAPPPKSTGREAWGPQEARRYVDEARRRGLQPDDIVATLTAFAARSIAHAYTTFLGPIDEVVVGGGGARNPTLLAYVRDALPRSIVRPSDDLGLSADAKEAVAFALLGYATLHGWTNNVPAATGAHHPVVMGSITPGTNYAALLRHVVTTPVAPPRRAMVEP